MKWNIIADSSCDLFDLEKESKIIKYLSVPFIINIDDREYFDDTELDLAELTEMMKKSKKIGSTSCPSPEAWLCKMDKDEYNICVTISKNLSGSYNSAVLAKKMFEEGEHAGKAAVIDSCATGPSSILAIRKITELIKEGRGFNDVVSQTEEYISSVRTVFALSCFDNLIKAGRMSKFAGVFATSLDFRGVGTEDGGKIKFNAKVRGKRKMIETMLDIMNKNSFSGKEAVICHCQNEILAEKICSEMKNLWREIYIKVMPVRGINSFYAEKGGIIISYR